MKLKAIILSAGEGSRMRPLTLTKPKTMLPVAGKPIIQYNIEALKDNGIMYCSFKCGEFEGERNGRFFLDLIEERFKQYVSKTNFEILKVCITQDVRPDRTEKWLNVIVRK